MCGHRAYIHGLQVPRTHARSRDAIKICSNCRLAGLRWCLRRRPLLMDGRCLAEKLDWCGFCFLLCFLFFSDGLEAGRRAVDITVPICPSPQAPDSIQHH